MLVSPVSCLILKVLRASCPRTHDVARSAGSCLETFTGEYEVDYQPETVVVAGGDGLPVQQLEQAL